MVVDGVEQGFDINLAFKPFSIGTYLDETGRCLFGVQGVALEGRPVVEVEFVSDFLKGGIQQNALLVEDDDRIDDVLEVSHLMGRDYYG